MAEILNKAIPKYKKLYNPKGFYVSDGYPKNFFIYNLVDTINNSYPAKIPVQIGYEGVYHFAPVRYRFSFSHIAVIRDGEMKVFSYLNCKDRGDNIEDVINYIKENFDYDETVIDRVRNYRKFGMYAKIDPQSHLDCNFY